MTNNHIAWLLVKHQRNELTPGEEQELDEWLYAAPANRERFNLYTSPEWASQKLVVLDRIDVKSAKRNVIRKIRRQRRPKRTKVIGYATSLFIIAVAASLFFWFRKDQKAATQTTIVKKENAGQSELKMDSGKVYLILEGDTTFEIQDAKDGFIVENDSLQVMKKGKLFVCKSNGSPSSKAIKLVTSWASQCEVQLPDSSRIWLNAVSSVRYPAEGSALTRSVQLEGEGYFDIRHDKSRPFGVWVNTNTEIEVLGTEFNINAYSDEGRIKASLVQGEIKINRDNEHKILIAGQSASIRPSKPIDVFPDRTIENLIAWKDEYFVFTRDSLSTIIRQFERWYNVKIRYTGAVHNLITSRITRSRPVDAALYTIFKDKVQITQKDRVIIVTPLPATVKSR